jgi:hypothetical protein
LCDTQVVSERARITADVLAYASIHGIACLAVSGAFRGMDAAQLWEQLEVVKSNLLSGLRNEEALVAPKTEFQIDPISKIKRLKRAFK